MYTRGCKNVSFGFFCSKSTISHGEILELAETALVMRNHLQSSSSGVTGSNAEMTSQMDSSATKATENREKDPEWHYYPEAQPDSQQIVAVPVIAESYHSEESEKFVTDEELEPKYLSSCVWL